MTSRVKSSSYSIIQTLVIVLKKKTLQCKRDKFNTFFFACLLAILKNLQPCLFYSRQNQLFLINETGRQRLGRGGRRGWVTGRTGRQALQTLEISVSFKGGCFPGPASDPSLTSVLVSYLGKTLARLISKSHHLFCSGKMIKSYFLQGCPTFWRR